MRNVEKEAGFDLIGVLLALQIHLGLQMRRQLALDPQRLRGDIPVAHNRPAGMAAALDPDDGHGHIDDLVLLHPAAVIDRVGRFAEESFIDPRLGDLLQIKRPVLRHDITLRIHGEDAAPVRALASAAGHLIGDVVDIFVPQTVGAHRARVEIQQVDRRKIHAQAGDDLRAELVLLRGAVLFRDIAEEHIIDLTEARQLRKMAVIVHPADLAVLPDDAVFHIVHIVVAAVGDLRLNGLLDRVEILRMDKAAEGMPRHRLKLLRRLTAENTEHGAVGKQQLLRLIRPIDKEPARDLFGHPFDHRQDMLRVQQLLQLVQCFALPVRLSSFSAKMP